APPPAPLSLLVAAGQRPWWGRNRSAARPTGDTRNGPAVAAVGFAPLRIDEELLRPDGRHENSAHQSSGQDHHARASVDRHRMTPSLRRGGQPPRTGFSLSLT